MTQLDVRSPVHARSEPEALIKEAKQRHRQRLGFMGLGVAALALVVGGLLVGMIGRGGGGGPSRPGASIAPATHPGGGSSHTQPTTSHTQPSSSSARSNPGVALASPTSTTQVQTVAPLSSVSPSCQTGQLSVVVGQSQGAAGTDYFPLVFTNRGPNLCALQGYPGVSFVDANGNQVVSAANRLGAVGGSVVLDSGSAATATAVVLEGAAGDCGYQGQNAPTEVSGFRVYPPDQTTAIYVPVGNPIPVCGNAPGNVLSIYAFDVQPSAEG
jgi:hypothetical protein